MSIFTDAFNSLLVIVGVGAFVMWFILCGLSIIVDLFHFKNIWGGRD